MSGVRAVGLSVLVLLAGLTTAGFSAGPAPARGPERTMSSELVVDGARSKVSPSQARRTTRTKPKPRKRNPETTFEVARTIEDVEALRPVWDRLQGPRLTSDIDVFLAHARHAPEMLRPHVVVVERDGSPAALVAGRLEDRELPSRLGYTTVFAPRLRTLTVGYGGLLGVDDEEGAALAFDALRRSIWADKVDLVRLRALERGSPVYDAVTRDTPALRRERFGRPVAHWRAKVTGSLDEFLARRKKKVRWQARHDVAQLEDTFGDEAEVKVFRSRDQLDDLLADTAAIYERTYQRALGVGFSTKELHRRLTELGMDRGWFRGYVLYLRGEPVAFWHGNAYRGTFGLGPTGFDPEQAEHRPGGYLLMRLVADLCADESVHTLDFGFGDGTYKRQLGDESRLEEDVVVFAPNVKAVSVNLVRTALQGTTAAARTVLERNGRLGDVKRAWRGRLSSRRSA